MSLRDLKVGDLVVLTSRYTKERHVQVPITKVGRKYITVHGHQFERDTGRDPDGYSNPYVSTIEDHARGSLLAAMQRTARLIEQDLRPWLDRSSSDEELWRMAEKLQEVRDLLDKR
jgi:hypothetical protein